MLAWLPKAPVDFAARVRAVDGTHDDAGVTLQFLASHALDETQLLKLARAGAKLRAAGCSLSPLAPFTLGLVTNSTTDFLSWAISGTAPRFGLDVDCVAGDYDQGLQESIDPGSRLNAARPRAVLVALDWRALGLRDPVARWPDPARMVDGALSRLATIRNGVRQHSGAVCIVQTIAPPPERVFGSLDRGVPGSLVSIIDEINRAIVADVQSTSDVLFDVADLAASVGLSNWHSPSQWNLAKLPFSGDYVSLYADHVCRLLAAMSGLSRRCLVLDLDNTLWGGVIGDDGLTGIRLAQGDAEGEAFLELQGYALALRDRGVVLAVSSKNDVGSPGTELEFAL